MFMNNERYKQIIDEVWKKYADSHRTPPENPNSKLLAPQLWSVKPMQHNKETFIREIKKNPLFSKNWGLKIEERELSLEERNDYYTSNYLGLDCESHEELNKLGDIPTKLITVTYKNEKIEVYE